MPDDFYQQQLRDQQWRLQQDMQRQAQQQWSNQLWQKDMDASRALQQNLSTTREQMARQHDVQLQEALQKAIQESKSAPQTADAQSITSTSRSMHPPPPAVSSESLHNHAAVLVVAIPLIAAGLRLGARWLGQRQQQTPQQKPPILPLADMTNVCPICGATNRLDYRFCLQCGVKRS